VVNDAPAVAGIDDIETKPLELILENGEYLKTCPVDYHGGERYPKLERIQGMEDLLSVIIKSRS